MIAAIKGDAECVDLLIKAGSDVTATDKSGNTAMDCAKSEGHTACVALLEAAR